MASIRDVYVVRTFGTQVHVRWDDVFRSRLMNLGRFGDPAIAFFATFVPRSVYSAQYLLSLHKSISAGVKSGARSPGSMPGVTFVQYTTCTLELIPKISPFLISIIKTDYNFLHKAFFDIITDTKTDT
jgi:hypothetical protein